MKIHVLKPSMSDFMLSVIVFLGIYIINCNYNYLNQFEVYKPFISSILKNAELIVIGLIFSVLLLIKPESICKIFAFLFVAVLSVYLSMDGSFMHTLWNNLFYPSWPIMLKLNYMYPIDPFQIIALLPIFLLRSYCEEGIIALTKLASRKNTNLI